MTSTVGSDPCHLYPRSYSETTFQDLCAAAFAAMAELMPGNDLPRVPGWDGATAYAELLDRYGHLPRSGAADPCALVREMSTDLLSGTTVWRSADLQYNIGSAVNAVASAMYALGLDLNVFLISDGQAGNAMMAERAVGAILAELAGIRPEHAGGVFTFGGTGTILYAIKAGIRKCAPDSVVSGLPADIAVMVTEDAHFSHEAAADWLGLGTDQLIVAPAGPGRASDVAAAESLLRSRIEAGSRIAAIVINGGTTYDHTIDDIAAFVQLRDRLVEDYDLGYRPHLHVDSVIGWAWLFMVDRDPILPDLAVTDAARKSIRLQSDRIAQIRLADSWGVDFHKGVGGCPVDCSYVQFNDRRDLARLRKGGARTTGLHQLADEFSSLSPVDYTLETSRSGGKALAALAALHSLGSTGYRTLLARLVDVSCGFRALLATAADVDVLNADSLGFCTMLRLRPPCDLSAAGTDHYQRDFFAWDNNNRMNRNGGGVVYSYSGSYRRRDGSAGPALKFYPTSPHTTDEQTRDAFHLLLRRKAEFDRAAP